jgi:TonB-linked SusC/RagA family outer membrane protein
MKRKLVFLMLFVCCFYGIYAQTAQRVIRGVVTSAEDGSSIPGVSVVVKGSTLGVTTNIEGVYELTVPEDAEFLTFSYIGMVSQEVAIDDKNVINVVMQKDVVSVEEVVVIAYGTAKKSSFTGSASTVTAEKLEGRTVSSVTSALEGSVAGIQSTSTGEPGSAPAIRIRGIGSISASSAPLYVVDGIPYDGNISAINPDDIESMSVLKDASASALYGARGANGVIMITTKKGKAGEPKLRFKSTFGTMARSIDRYETVSASEYMELTYEGYRNQLQYADGYSRADAEDIALNGRVEAERELPNYVGMLGGEMYNPYNVPSNSLIDPVTGKIDPNAKLRYLDDWYEEATRDNPIRQEYMFSATGGNERTTYMMSLGYLDEKGIVENSKFKRLSGRLNLDTDLKSWLKAGMNASYSNTKKNYLTDEGTSYNNIWYSTLDIAPIYPVYKRLDSGDYDLDGNGNRQYDYGETRAYSDNYNVIATLFDDSRRIEHDNLSARTYAELYYDKDEINFLQGFKLRVNYGFDFFFGDQLVYQNPYHGDASNVGGRGWKVNTKVFSYTFNQLLTWQRSFNNHNLDVLAGHEFYKFTSPQLESTKQGYPFGGVTELAVAASEAGSSSVTDNYAVDSYLSRINYNYADKYYLSASFRTDGSSRFFKDSRWGSFWSGGASWRVSEEGFMAPVDWLNNLTLKASYGEQGNDQLLDDAGDPSYYAWQSLYDLANPNNVYSGAFYQSLENQNLRWEKNQNLNAGFETRLFNRVSLSFDWYKKWTSDLLLDRPMPLSSGVRFVWENIGEMTNQGIDFEYSVDILRGNFKWILGGQLSHFSNEVTKLVTDGQELVSGLSIITVGEPINSFYMAKSAGVDPITGKQLYWTRETVTDDDGNEIEKEVITDSYNEAAANRSIMGSRIPDFSGSIRNDFSYKGFDLSALLTFSKGGKIYEWVYAGLQSTRNPGTNWHSILLNRWQKPGDVTDVPILQLGTVNYPTERMLIDASYLTVKNVSLAYNFPKRWVNDIGVSNLKLFFTGENLVTFAKLQGMNPQYNFSGGQNYSYVPIRVLSFGIDIQF